MTDESNESRSQSHFVPCVLRTLEILDALRHARPGLRIEDLRATSRASRSTTYRIVRSLLHSGYIERDTTGRYHLNPVIIQFANDSHASTRERRVASICDEPAEGFERWGVRFRLSAAVVAPPTNSP
jgi:hypothetical protein